MEQWKLDAFNHAKRCQPLECCGILAKNKGELQYWECNNVAKNNPEYSFVIDPLDWADCEDSVDEIVGIVHSHPDFDMNFSPADIASCNALDLRFYLVNPDTKTTIYIDPEESHADKN